MYRIPNLHETEWGGRVGAKRPIDFNDDEGPEETRETLPDLVVFGAERWDDSSLRTQRIFTRFALDRRVFFIEAPVQTDDEETSLHVSVRILGVKVITPRLAAHCRQMTEREREAEVAGHVTKFAHRSGIVLDSFTAWFECPGAYRYARLLEPTVTIYDCTRDVSTDDFTLRDLEWELLERTDLVFTASYALCMAKMYLHPNVQTMPSPTAMAEESRAWGELQARMARAEREVRERKLRCAKRPAVATPRLLA